jgi:CDP-diacylglycerol--glycerol-3-phosphate 3-phosphatidyltransferase
VLEAKLRGLWDRALGPVGRVVARSGIGPNSITVLGMAAQVAVGYEIVSDHLVIAGLIAIVGALGDALDGAVARAGGVTTRFGALLDSTTDRVSDALFFGPVAWLYAVSGDPARAGQRWVGAVALIALVASFLVSYVKARAEGLGIECKVGILARAERTILMILALLFDLLPLIIVILATLSIVTVIQRLVHARARARSAV